jgi:hypothetical protein
MSYPWFRFYSEFARDRKNKVIARQAEAPMPTVWSVMVLFLCLANDSPERGVLRNPSGEPMKFLEIAQEAEDLLGIDPQLFKKLHDALVKERVIFWDTGTCKLIHWPERQFASDYSTPRVKEWRAKHAGNVTETLQERSMKHFRNAPEADTESEAEANTETESSGGEVVGEAAAAAAQPIYENDEWIPEAYQHPDIVMIEKITNVLPAEKEITKILQTMQMIKKRYELSGDTLDTYLSRFWVAWRNGKNKRGNSYSKLNFAWLYEWAMNDHIPDYGANGDKRAGDLPGTTEADRQRYAAEWEQNT